MSTRSGPLAETDCADCAAARGERHTGACPAVLAAFERATGHRVTRVSAPARDMAWEVTKGPWAKGDADQLGAQLEAERNEHGLMRAENELLNEQLREAGYLVASLRAELASMRAIVDALTEQRELREQLAQAKAALDAAHAEVRAALDRETART